VSLARDRESFPYASNWRSQVATKASSSIHRHQDGIGCVPVVGTGLLDNLFVWAS
jgi:hypothetical protein